jgi:hypothetical protein
MALNMMFPLSDEQANCDQRTARTVANHCDNSVTVASRRKLPRQSRPKQVCVNGCKESLVVQALHLLSSPNSRLAAISDMAQALGQTPPEESTMVIVNNSTDSNATDIDSLEQQFRYPEGMKVYGMIIDDRIPSALVRVGLNALSKVDADLLVFLCLEADDIRNRTDWEELASEIRFGNGKQGAYEVRLVNSHEELMVASLNMRVIRLPEYTVI